MTVLKLQSRNRKCIYMTKNLKYEFRQNIDYLHRHIHLLVVCGIYIMIMVHTEQSWTRIFELIFIHRLYYTDKYNVVYINMVSKCRVQ